MKRGKNIRDEGLDKLKKTPFFDDETLIEIRKDLDLLTDEEIKKSESKIKQNTNTLKLNYYENY